MGSGGPVRDRRCSGTPLPVTPAGDSGMRRPAAPARPLILFYNPFWEVDPVKSAPRECAELAELTSDRGRFREADAVVFHIPGLRDLSNVAKRRGQIWVARSLESDVFYPHQCLPAFMKRFDLTATYKLDSDLPVLYLDRAVIDSLRSPCRPRQPPRRPCCLQPTAGSARGAPGFLWS